MSETITPVGQDWYVRNMHNYDDHIIYENVEFGDVGAGTVSARVSSIYEGFTLQIKLDNVGTEPIATIEVPNTGFGIDLGRGYGYFKRNCYRNARRHRSIRRGWRERRGQ